MYERVLLYTRTRFISLNLRMCMFGCVSECVDVYEWIYVRMKFIYVYDAEEVQALWIHVYGVCACAFVCVCACVCMRAY